MASDSSVAPWSASASATCGCCSSCVANPAFGLSAAFGLVLPLKLVGALGGGAGGGTAATATAGGTNVDSRGGTAPHVRVNGVELSVREPAAAVSVNCQLPDLADVGQL